MVAIVSEEVYNDLRKAHQIWEHFKERDDERNIPYNDQWKALTASQAVGHLTVPIFTFTHDERWKTQPWFTGGEKLWSMLNDYFEQSDNYIERDRSFFVPFSNGAELGMHGKDAMVGEFRYVTTETQFRDTFGISPTELKAREEAEFQKNVLLVRK